MKCFRIIFVFIMISIASLSTHQFSCTLVSVSDNSSVWFGNNEDAYPNWMGKIFFKTGEKGTFGYMFHGFADGFFQGGMNEKGLVIGWVAGSNTNWTAAKDKKNYPDNLNQKILTECTNVNDALLVLRTYNQPHFARASTMLADRSGSAAAVSWNDGKLKIYKKKLEILAMGFGQAECVDILKGKKFYSLKNIINALDQSIQNSRIKTIYSIAYDLKKGEFWIFNILGIEQNSINNGGAIKLNLKNELVKGDHHYDLIKIRSQLNKLVGKRYFTPIKKNGGSESLKFFEGNYKCEDRSDFSIRLSGKKILMKWSKRAKGEFSLYPGIDGNLYAEYRYLKVGHEGYKKEPENSFKLTWIERDGKIKAVKVRKIIRK